MSIVDFKIEFFFALNKEKNIWNWMLRELLTWPFRISLSRLPFYVYISWFNLEDTDRLTAWRIEPGEFIQSQRYFCSLWMDTLGWERHGWPRVGKAWIHFAWVALGGKGMNPLCMGGLGRERHESTLHGWPWAGKAWIHFAWVALGGKGMNPLCMGGFGRERHESTLHGWPWVGKERIHFIPN